MWGEGILGSRYQQGTSRTLVEFWSLYRDIRWRVVTVHAFGSSALWINAVLMKKSLFLFLIYLTDLVKTARSTEFVLTRLCRTIRKPSAVRQLFAIFTFRLLMKSGVFQISCISYLASNFVVII
jgi:hypothetical protein